MPRSWTHNADLRRIKETLDALPHGEKSDYAQAIADRYDISKSTLYRALKDRFGKQKESPKKAEVPDALVRKIAEIKETYASKITLKNSSRTLPTKDAVDIAIQEGVDEAGQYSVSAIQAGLHRHGYTTQEPYTRVEADYALQQVQLDFSRSHHFQVLEPTGDSDWWLEVSTDELHYKDGEVKLRTWVVQMVDEYSRLRLVRYYPATSESGILGVDFLRWAYNRPGDNHPLKHLPDRLKTDQGPFAKSTEGQTALDALGIEPILAKPEQSSTSQGKVERSFRTLWQWEAKMATRLVRQHGEGTTIRLSTLRELMHVRTVEEANKDHPFFRDQVRGKMYRRSLEERSRKLDDWPRRVDHDVLDLATRTWERTVDKTRLVYVDNVPFEAPAYATGHRVRVHRTANGEWYATLIDGYHKGESFELKPYDVEALDEYENHPAKVPRQEIQDDVDDHLAQLVESEQPEVDDTPADPEAPATESTEEPTDTLTLLEARAQVGRALREQGIEDPTGYIQDLVDAGVLTGGMSPDEVDRVTRKLTAQTA